MLRRIFYKPSSTHSQKGQPNKNSTRLQGYQMQRIDHLMDAILKKISELQNKIGTIYFSKIDLKYAYSQMPLHKEAQRHCNFNILGGNATGTYRFINGFYGPTDMLATFQKVMDYTLINIPSAHAFLDDIIRITKSTQEDHENEIDKDLYKLDKEKLAISLQKCEFLQTEITWLGYKKTQMGSFQQNAQRTQLPKWKPHTP